MRNRLTTPKRKQQGAILIVALMFLIAITLYTLSSMGSANIGLYLAQNEESRISAEQAAQALADAIVSTPASTPVVGQSGFTACTANETGCNRNDLAIVNAVLASQVTANHMQARVERTGSDFQPPPRVFDTSIDKFTSATIRVTTTYDRVGEGLGRQQDTERVLVLVPKL